MLLDQRADSGRCIGSFGLGKIAGVKCNLILKTET
jgi:hypothetical protein